MSNSDPVDCSLPGSSVYMDSPGKNTGEGAMPSSGDPSNPGIESVSLKSLALAGRFFTTSATWEALGFNAVLYLVIQLCLTL